MSSINLVLRVLATLFALFHCSSALEHPISMSAGAYEWKVQGMLILVCFLVLHAGQGDAGPAALSAIGRKAWGHLARWCYGHYRWGTVSPGVGPVGWWCKSRFCWCWHCWQVPPPLPWVGKTPTNCCCGWWTYLCPSVDQMWVSAILLHFWNFVWRKSQAHAYRTLEIINIISNNRNQNIVVQRWGGGVRWWWWCWLLRYALFGKRHKGTFWNDGMLYFFTGIVVIWVHHLSGLSEIPIKCMNFMSELYHN